MMKKLRDEPDERENETQITVERTGRRPLMFDGELVDQVFGANGKTNRWHDLSVYKTRNFKFVVVIAFQTTWDGEVDHSAAYVVDTPEEVATILEEHNPTEYVQGFPPISPQHVLKQEALLREIHLRYRGLVSGLLAKMPGIEEIVE